MSNSTLLDIADEIHRELGSPEDLLTGLIVYWLRANIGLLNDRLDVSYDINVNGTIIPQVNLNEKVIFKKLYFIHYYDTKLRAVLNMAANDSVIEVSENGATVRRLNKTEQAKVYKELKRDENLELDTLVNSYKRNQSIPVSVDGNDTIEGVYPD